MPFRSSPYPDGTDNLFYISAPTDNFIIHFFLNLLLFSVICCDAWLGLNPDESIPKNICLIVVRRMKEEIILSRMVPVILSVNFCNVVK